MFSISSGIKVRQVLSVYLVSSPPPPPDVAIGAPYEAGTGVVYIYNGAKTGLYHKYSQRIVGSDIDTGLRAFGYAISRPWDIDGNYYAGKINRMHTGIH